MPQEDSRSNTPTDPARRRAVKGLLLLLGLLTAGMIAVMLNMPSASPPPASDPAADRSISQTVYDRLDAVRNQKYTQLQHYLARIEKLANQAGRDPYLREGFDLKFAYQQMQRNTAPPPQAVAAMETLDQNLLAHTIDRYSEFYDVLFIASDGTVIHTIRRNDLRGVNIFQGEQGETSLARRLKASPAEAFVDFKRSSLAAAPSACFVEPVRGEDFEGWIVMQCSINNLNEMFTRETSLGRTGETFLVNRDRAMLTNSRFRRESSILNLHLSPENIESKFAEREGHKVVIDYRGCRAMTSFKVCSVMGSEWLLIAKIDEAEVLTDFYRQHRREVRESLLQAVRRQRGPFLDPADAPEPPRDPIPVGMDEYRIAETGQSLETFGVSSCTAVVAYLPGSFAYMGHASSYDAMYGGEDLDLLSNMIQRIRTYEIRPYELRQLKIIVIAPHTDSLAHIIDTLVDEGIFLAQICFAHQPQAQRADVWHDVAAAETQVSWRAEAPRAFHQLQVAEDAPRIGEIARQLWLPAES